MTDLAPTHPATWESGLRGMLLGMRPKQWLKNAFVFAALVFAGRLGNIQDLARVGLAFTVFCLISSAGYLINDIVDADRDRLHPSKRFRPLASGLLSPAFAAALATVLVTIGLAAAIPLGWPFVLVAAGYVLVTAAYTRALKYIMLLDVLTVACGFVLRAVGGAAAIDVPVSVWLCLLTLLAAAFIGFGKRYADLPYVTAMPQTTPHWPATYNRRALELLVRIIGSCILAAYICYALLARGLPADHIMILTAPLVAFGLYRYHHTIQTSGVWSAPEDVLLHDFPLALTVLSWAAASILLLYWIR